MVVRQFVDGQLRAEVRWFVPGDVPAGLRPNQPPRRRVDSYSVPSLSPLSSIKRRGDRRSLESKVRVGRVELVHCGAAIGFAERWEKQQLDDSSPAVPHGPWLDVDKRIWCVGDAELTRLSVAGTRWWTVAVGVEDAEADKRARVRAWLDAVAAAGAPHSYASLLTELCRHPSVRDAVA
jgi:hypothetical protein